MNIVGRLLCWIFGHKRGRRITKPQPSNLVESVIKDYSDANFLGCPRCGRVWRRRAKKEA